MKLFTNLETADLLGIKPNTLEIWRLHGKGPPFLKFGRTKSAPVRYGMSAVIEWLDEHTFASTSGYGLAGRTRTKFLRAKCEAASRRTRTLQDRHSKVRLGSKAETGVVPETGRRRSASRKLVPIASSVFPQRIQRRKSTYPPSLAPRHNQRTSRRWGGR